MPHLKSYENYPCGIILISNLVSIVIYSIGAYILSQLGNIIVLFYILYLIALEINLMKSHCVNCYYYGKFCAFGKGKLSAVFFKKGNSKKFVEHKITWKELLPDLLVSLVPMVAGIVLLILKFNWIMLALIILLVVLTTVGNGFVRGNLACKFCKQKELGCPAEQLFNKNKKT
ncbi:MAG: hypothetical protein V1859_11460 [archaeon]